MPESVSDLAVPTTAPHPFNQSSADVTLRTADCVDFYVYRPILSQASPVFADMFSLPQPSSVFRDAMADRPVVHVTEDSRALERLLRICYPIVKEKLDNLEDIVPVLQAAMKYDMEWPISQLTTDLRAIVPQTPLKVWAVACRCGLETLAREAAATIVENTKGEPDSEPARRRRPARRRTATAPLALLASMLQDSQDVKEILRGISAGDYFRLREYLRSGDDQPTTNLLSPTIDISALPTDPPPESPSPSPTSLIPHFPPPDVILRCADGTEVRAHTLSLVLHSPILAERVRTLLDPSTSSQSRDGANAPDPQASLCLQMDVGSSTLSTLLAVMYGGNSHLPSNLHSLSSTLMEAKRFGLAGVAEAAQDRWNTLATSSPLEAYFIAVERGLADSAIFAARKVLEGPVAGIYSSAMESSTALAYHRLLEYYKACASSIQRRMQDAVAGWNEELSDINSNSGSQYSYAGGHLENVWGIGAYLTGLATSEMNTDVSASRGCSFDSDLSLAALLRESCAMWPSSNAPLYRQFTEVLTKISKVLPQLVADAIAEVQLEVQ